LGPQSYGVYSEIEDSLTVTTKAFGATQPTPFEGFYELSSGPTNNVTQNLGPAPLNNGFTLQQAGVYYISFDLVFNRLSGTGNDIYEVAGFVNGIQNPNSLNLSSRRNNDQTNATLTAIGVFSIGDVFDVRIRQNSGGASTLQLVRTNLTIYRLA